MRALVIQDDDGTSRILARAFAELGFDTVEVPLGEEGVAFAQAYRFDMFCVDDNLPDLSGYDVLCRIRRFDSVTPAMFVSSAAYDADIAARARASGAQGLLGLPFRAIDFARLVGDLHHAARGFGPYKSAGEGDRG
jgi:DNA-binding response OmpR family regulator